MTKKRKPTILKTSIADHEFGVTTVQGGNGAYRKKVCKGCPWKKSETGKFPAEAFLLSANTAHDMSTHTFACHEAGVANPTTCAGFLLRGADHNLTVRLGKLKGKYQDIQEPTEELFDCYAEMAEANGVDPQEPDIRACR